MEGEATMVGNIASGPDATLRDVLVARARGSSDGRLVADVVGGIGVLLVAATWHPRAWLTLACAALCFVSFGAWGITDRELGERGRAGPRWAVLLFRGLRGLAVVTGAVAAAALLLQALALALGTWIS